MKYNQNKSTKVPPKNTQKHQNPPAAADTGLQRFLLLQDLDPGALFSSHKNQKFLDLWSINTANIHSSTRRGAAKIISFSHVTHKYANDANMMELSV